jgi:hypothetical protein
MNSPLNPRPEEKVLHCWKEIAAYLSAGVRTVQRWESEFSLPVRRPRGTKRSAVLAFSSEIDQWISNLPVASRASSGLGMALNPPNPGTFPAPEAFDGPQMGSAQTMF